MTFMVKETEIFVFGSNRQGWHSKGAALDAATRYGAVRGQGEGLQGRSYAIPTREKDPDWRGPKPRLRTLTLAEVAGHVETFLAFARGRAGLTFRLTPIGCGYAGFEPAQIAPLFKGAPANVIIPEAFAPFVGGGRRACVS